MNDEQIETLLRKAPRPVAPAGLLETLQSNIALPPRAETARVNRTETTPLLRRWFPAISFAVIFLSCIVAIAVQTNQIAELNRGNETLRGATQNLEQLRRDNAEYQKLQAEHQELERLRKDFAELQQLRAEVAQLREQIQETEKLRAQNQQLLAANNQPAQSTGNDDSFARFEADARAEAESVYCINNLKQIGLAARIWATDNGGVYPPNWLSMSNELSTPKVLVCRGDKGRTAARSWNEFGPGNVSYEFLNPNGSDKTPMVLLARCPIHGHVGLSDGSVQSGSGLGRTFTIIVKDGKQVYTPLNKRPDGSPYE
ncbi:MAG: hypothetical protein DME22_15395 [Verrucomicrobia bacterium]|nr:MAG: hypothetical protein DME22_15395 [Verrucomicrobiota bacterium]PYK02194.1 MAG: hypothetical protein DME23_02275 [Verrucomicrobiota bacterium]